MLVALLVCLIPTTIGGLLSAIGIAGMDRMIQANVIATSGRAVEAAGDVNVLLLDKTGTITLGNRQAVECSPQWGNRPARTSPKPPSFLPWQMKHPKDVALWCLRRKSMGFAGDDIHELRSAPSSLYCPNPHERCADWKRGTNSQGGAPEAASSNVRMDAGGPRVSR